MGCGSSSSSAASDADDVQAPQAESALKQYVKQNQPRLADLDVSKTIGIGTFSRVQICKIKADSSLPPLALKCLSKKEIMKLQQVEHVKAEKQILLQINHAFIVDLVGTFQDEGNLYMMMEYVNGGELHSYIQSNSCDMNPDTVRFFTAECYLALAYLHSLKIAHRDIKPSNILITCDGHIKLTDFGFAKIIETSSNTLVGTPEYVAPEIIKRSGHAHAVDWWAYGVVLFEMFAGYTPYQADDMEATFALILEGKLEFPKKFDPKAKDLVTGLLNPDPEKRIGSRKRGTAEVKSHGWFKGTEWSKLLNCTLKSPYVPSVSGPDDTRMFEMYPEKRGDEEDEKPNEEEQSVFYRFSTNEANKEGPAGKVGITKQKIMPDADESQTKSHGLSSAFNQL